MSDPATALVLFSVTCFALPLTMCAAWSLFKGLIG